MALVIDHPIRYEISLILAIGCGVFSGLVRGVYFGFYARNLKLPRWSKYNPINHKDASSEAKTDDDENWWPDGQR